MNVYIDGKKLDVQIEANDSLTSIINYIEKAVSENQRVIYETQVNGQFLSDVEISDINEIEDLEFFTKRPKILLLETMQESISYIEKLKFGIKELIDLLVNENEKEAMELVVKIINGLEWLHNLINSIEQTTSIEFSEVEFEGTNIRFKDTVAELLEALENNDMIMLSDLFEYEILEILEELPDDFSKMYDTILDEEKQELNYQ